jgi:hypothetical protein
VFRCERCQNTGKILEQFADFGPLLPPMEEVTSNREVPIKWRRVECPECLGFGAAGWALPG